MKYRVVYFTELGDHDKDKEISRALAGDHIFDGFLDSETRREAKRTIAELLERLNDGDVLTGQRDRVGARALSRIGPIPEPTHAGWSVRGDLTD